MRVVLPNHIDRHGTIIRHHHLLEESPQHLPAPIHCLRIGECPTTVKLWKQVRGSLDRPCHQLGKETDIGKKGSVAAFKGLKKVAGVSFKALSIGITGAATAIGAIVTSSVKSYAENEQLVGGVDTLFKEHSKTVQKYANNAYKTAGLSANAYMETATSFSASLLQSLGRDTKKAAEYADMAISDMADNSNKLGTPMESIQETYQSLAKGNYAMLDNLKLGKIHYCSAT